MPEADSPALPAVQFVGGDDAIECCAACHFWNQARLQKGTPEGIQAPCRRYPRRAAFYTTIQAGPRGPVPVQSPVMLETYMPATEVCGEFRIRLPDRHD